MKRDFFVAQKFRGGDLAVARKDFKMKGGKLRESKAEILRSIDLL